MVIDCDNRTYGYNCVYNCSGHCLDNSPCNKQTGLCDRGCNPGYTNSNCSKGKITDECIYFFSIKNLNYITNLLHNGYVEWFWEVLYLWQTK